MSDFEWTYVTNKLPEDGQKILFVYKNDDQFPWYKYPLSLQKGDFKLLKDGYTFRVDVRPINNKEVLCWAPVPKEPKQMA